MADPRYPIGQVSPKGALTTDERQQAFSAMAALPNQLYDAVRGLSETQLDTPYRAGGWNLRQVVHHLADSHINAYGRHKLTISENMPTLQAYDEGMWANMVDANAPIGSSLLILQGIHTRLVDSLRSQPERVFKRRAMHSEGGEMTLDDLVTMYAWHGAHHVAHITTLRAQKGW
ncbi:MAG: putative damage-inducible protein DinB [Planctomycetota bacterium]